MTDDPLLARARDLWMELADTPVEFCPSGGAKVVVAPRSRLCPPSWTGVVRIGDAAIVTAPSVRAAGMVDDAARKMSPEELFDVARLRAVLPVLDVLGPASLFYLGQDGLLLPAHQVTGVEQLPIGDGDLAALLALAGQEEAGESGLEDISSPAFCLRRGNEVVAAAGYRSWPRSVAHLSVLVAPHCRGQRLARAVASPRRRSLPGHAGTGSSTAPSTGPKTSPSPRTPARSASTTQPPS
ncbi:GNAT family N-acetyltransferase [Streptomyces sp. NPDC005181]|uniref:GNAT family N-acetyltransferase n=1 Tax=Streptomyces sp. NPDC005181 TaxID=3156869 RepID=UPI0033A1950F